MSVSLRQDLALTPVDPDLDGTPCFVLHDPAAGKYYRLSTLEVTLLSGPLDPPVAAAERATRTLGRPVPPQLVERFVAFLRQHDLIRAHGPMAITGLQTKAQRMRGSPAQRFVRSYLFLRIPLIRPDRFLERTLPWVRWLLTKQAAWGAVILAVIGLIRILPQWDQFLASFLYFFSWQGLLAYGVMLFGLKCIHELGHAYTAKNHGARVFTQGIAFMVFWPVFYTDTTDSWRLASRRARLDIAAAGIRIELMLAGLCLFLWPMMEDGPARSLVFMAATSTWLLTLIVNLNPLMKFDGYFILADLMNSENLQERALALWTWRRHRFLWGFKSPPPESPRRWLDIYAVFVWLYRFMLTFSVALMVYAFVFKALGLVLMLLQLTLFVGVPVVKDLGAAAKGWRHINPWVAMRTVLLAGALIGLALLPLPTAIISPGLQAPEVETLYAPADARVETPPPPIGTVVAPGQVLFSLVAAELEHQLAETARDAEMLRWQLSVLGLEARIAGRAQVIEAELRSTLDRRRGLLDQQTRLTLTASREGVIGERAAGLRVGSWVGAGDPLATLVAPTRLTTTAYLSERSLARVEVGDTGLFHPSDPAVAPIPVRVRAIEAAALRELDQHLLGTPRNGEIPARILPDGRMVPTEAIYKLILDAPAALPNGSTLTGRIVLTGTPESLMATLWRRASAILTRELAF